MNIHIKNIMSVVPMTEKDYVLEDVNIYIKDKNIFHIGDELKDFNFDKVIDGSGMVALPGLINTHTHLAMTLFRNYADDMKLEDWLFKKIFPLEDKLMGEDVYYGSKLGLIEMIKSGTTCFLDMYFFVEDTLKAINESKIRACISRGLTSGEGEDAKIQEVRDLYGKYNDYEGRIKIMVGPHAVYTCSEDFLKKCLNLTKELNTRLHIHLNESKNEVEESLKAHGKSPIEWVDYLGLLEVPTIAAHCVWLNENDMNILKNKNVNVAHNPVSNLKIASGIANIYKMQKEGINVCLGTDGAASNNNLNMFKDLNITSLLSKGLNLEPVATTAYETLEMATINGAKALGLEDLIGTLEVGKEADIILIDFNKPHLKPKNNVISSLVYSAFGSDVDTVIVKGNVLMENRKIKVFDEVDTVKEIDEYLKKRR